MSKNPYRDPNKKHTGRKVAAAAALIALLYYVGFFGWVIGLVGTVLQIALIAGGIALVGGGGYLAYRKLSGKSSPSINGQAAKAIASEAIKRRRNR